MALMFGVAQGVPAPGSQDVYDTNYDSPTWRNSIAAGYTPYHRLTAADFRVDDGATSESAIYTTGFIHYKYEGTCMPARGHRVRAVAVCAEVLAGFDSSKSWRRQAASSLDYLSHEQGHLDINELAAIDFAKDIVRDPPAAEGGSPPEALASLGREFDRRYRSMGDQNTRDQAAYDSATDSGVNVQAQAKWAAAMAARLAKAHVAPTWTPPNFTGASCAFFARDGQQGKARAD